MTDYEITNLLIDYGRKCELLDIVKRTLRSREIPSYALENVIDVLLKGDETDAEEESEA